MCEFLNCPEFFEMMKKEIIMKEDSKKESDNKNVTLSLQYLQKIPKEILKEISCENAIQISDILQVLAVDPGNMDLNFLNLKAAELQFKEKREKIKLLELEKDLKNVKKNLNLLEGIEINLQKEVDELEKEENEQNKTLKDLKIFQKEILIPKNEFLIQFLENEDLYKSASDLIDGFGSIECIPEDLDMAKKIFKQKFEELEKLDKEISSLGGDFSTEKLDFF